MRFPTFSILLSPLLLACANPPVAVWGSSNENIDVETLFEHDSCTVYRFRDLQYHYYARCSGSSPTAQTMTSVSCGKNCVREEAIPTENVPISQPK